MAYDRSERPYGRDVGGRDAGARDPRGPYDRDGRDDRSFFERAGDEVRSWFGDEEAERRRRYDERYDERQDRLDPRAQGGYRSYERSNRDDGATGGGYAGGRAYAAPYGQPEAGRQFDDDGARSGGDYRVGGYGYDRDGDRARRAAYRAAYEQRGDQRGHGYADRGGAPSWQADDHHGYGDWRDRQLSAFDRDYAEYRQENRARFESEFATWRQARQTQRDSLAGVKEHQEVVGSDGGHVGTVDHVRSDHILLTKTDRDAGGHHHAIPSSWLATVGDKVELKKTADEAKREWREAEGRGGLFGAGGDAARTGREHDGIRPGGGNLDRSFSGTY